MKARLQALENASDDPTLHAAILQSINTEIENNVQLQEKIGEILPFLSDNNRNIRIQAMNVLGFFNSTYKIPTVKKTLFDMATIKLQDGACLEVACSIISANIDIVTDEQREKAFEDLLKAELRTSSLNRRLAAYNLFQVFLIEGVAINESIIPNFKKFCGYEQDPRCLHIIFNSFPVLAQKLLPKINTEQRFELFDSISCFYPIQGMEDLATSLNKALASHPEFADEIATLVTEKLRNALADTREPVFQSLPILLIHPTLNDLVIEIVRSFMYSLKGYFEGEEKDARAEIVNKAIECLAHFIDINKESIPTLINIIISEFIPEILSSHDPSTIRSTSIVCWYIDTVAHFAKQAMLPLSCVADDAVANNDSTRLQSIIASVVEFLKIQKPDREKESDMNMFLKHAVAALKNNDNNVKLAGLVCIRELASHYLLKYNEEIIPGLLTATQIIPFVIDVILRLSEQPRYQEKIIQDIVIPLTKAISNNEKFGNSTDPLVFASHLSISPIMKTLICEAFIESRHFRDLLSIVLTAESLPDDFSEPLLQKLDSIYSQDARNVVLAIAVRSSPEVIAKALHNCVNIYPIVFSACEPSNLPENIPLDDPQIQLLVSCKLSAYPAGFAPDPIAFAIRNELPEDFKATDIPRLLDFENQFDQVNGAIDKFDLVSKFFLYDPDYKIQLWQKFHMSLDDDPLDLCKLCLLCPPDFFIEDMVRLLPFISTFFDYDVSGTLDLLFFILLKISPRSMISLIKEMNAIMGKLLQLLYHENPHVRLDVCRILYSIPAQINESACGAHKSRVCKALRVVLDDNKREIRKVAAEARVVWFKIPDL